MLSIAIALQAANIAPPIDFDLGKMKPPETDCRADAAGSGRDIIVCASRDKQVLRAGRASYSSLGLRPHPASFPSLLWHLYYAVAIYCTRWLLRSVGST